MSKKISVVLSDELIKLIDETVINHKYDYEEKRSVFIRGAIIRELRRRQVII